jgi:LysM repeat protein
VIDYKVSPELGIFERRLGSDGVSTSGGTITAREVNGIPVANYLASICASATAMASSGGQAPAAGPGSQPQAYGSQQPPAAYSGYTTPQPESRAYPPQAVQPKTTTITHTIAKGETLFGVSRKYGTTVDAIKAQNGLTSNTLFPGQQLSVVSTQAPVTGQAVTMAPTVPTMPYNAGPVATSNPGAAQPTPYGGTAPATPQAYGSAAPSSRSGQAAVYGEDVHMVQPGETVASIALKYGFTSAKFREMNELGPNDFVKVGQQLKTSDCNCPAPAVPQEVAPEAYGQQAPAVPQAYGQPAAPPQAIGNQQPATPQAYGNQQPAPTATSAYRTPEGYRAPQASPVPAQSTPAAPAEMSITNNPNFGLVVPNVSAPASTSLNQLESRGSGTPAPATTPNPATYNTYPAPAAAPQTYGSNSPQPVPNAYGTPVGVNAVPAPTPSNRSFHLVQEGESLYSIARRYGLTTDQLRALNNLDNGGVIVPFQKLYVN